MIVEIERILSTYFYLGYISLFLDSFLGSKCAGYIRASTGFWSHQTVQSRTVNCVVLCIRLIFSFKSNYFIYKLEFTKLQ